MKTIKAVIVLLKEYVLCNNCLGRQFAMLGHGLTNEERGKALKIACVIEANRLVCKEDEQGREVLLSIATNGFSNVAIKTLEAIGFTVEAKEVVCHICEGVFNHVDEIAEYAVQELAKYDYDSFLVGIKADVEVEEREDELRSKFGIQWGESIRNELSREIGKRIMEKTKKTVDLRRPDILVLINPFKRQIFLQINSLFISGRYRKLVRGIPQSRWLCRMCKGKGCQKCGRTGKMYPISVEELIATPLVEMTKGKGAKLHASGREDIDVRTFGSGRPFVAEAMKPKLRTIDLDELRTSINLKAEGKIEVNALKFSSKEMVRRLKRAEKSVKVYRAVVEFSEELSEEDRSKIEGLNKTLVHQLTPLRVAHRRAIKIRKKYLYGIKLKKLGSNLIEMLLRCQGGLYVKELINGDEGRTRPSISEVVGFSAKCLELDVIEIELEEAF